MIGIVIHGQGRANEMYSYVSPHLHSSFEDTSWVQRVAASVILEHHRKYR